MLLKSLYDELTFRQDSDNLTCQMTIDKAHPIFEGHYPEHPVLPGACILSMISDAVSTFLDTDILLEESTELKFLRIVDPNINNQISIKFDHIPELDNQRQAVQCNVFHNGDICCKYKGIISKL